ncbi:hypothetical protein P4O66_020758, partial [Electrophorus voltai]
MPLLLYRVNSPSVALCSVRELCDWMESESWACLSLSSLLPSSAPYLTRVELNPLLSWSAHMTTLRGRSQPALLVGVVEVSSSRATLRLVDQTAAVDCVCVEATQAGGQHTAINTAWIGCLSCVLVCYRMSRVCSGVLQAVSRVFWVYIQVCVDDLHILSPTAAMTAVLREGQRGGEDRMKEGERSCPPPPDRRPAAQQRRGGAEGGMESSEGSEREERYVLPPVRRKRKRGVEEMNERQASRPRDLGHHGNDPRAAESSSVPCDPCVSLLFRLEAKHGVAFRNVQTSSEAQGLTLSFVAKATCLGNAQRWDGDPRNRRVEEREMGGATEVALHLLLSRIELQFVDFCVRWFPLLQSGSVYRLTALHTQDVSVLSGSSVPVRGGVTLLSSPSLLMQPEWRIHTVTPSIPTAQVRHTHAITFYCTGVNMLLFQTIFVCEGVLIPVFPAPLSDAVLIWIIDASVELDLRVRLTVQDAEAPDRSVQVYLDLSRTPYIPALLPGATVQLLHFQRRVSVVRNVYCWSLPISCVTVTGLGSVKPHPPPPLVHLGVWTLAKAEQSIVGQITVHVVCVLFLRLQWVCSFCGSVFRQFSLFACVCRVAVEDGTGEAQVWFSTETVAKLLLLAVPEWEGLQRHIRSKGHLRVYARARSM